MLDSVKNWFKYRICERGQHTSCFFDGIWNPLTEEYMYEWGSCSKGHDTCVGKLDNNSSTKPCDSEFLKCLKLRAPIWLAYIMYGVVRVTTRWYK